MRRAYTGAAIFDGARMRSETALLVDGATCAGLAGADAIPSGHRRTALDGGTVLPGFVDLQVNGGGGVLLNDAPTVAGVAAIAAAHAGLGTRALLPTLISDRPERTAQAVAAVAAAIAQGVPGVVGLHLEGPHIARARCGAHDPARIRAMTGEDLALLLDAAARLPNLMVTLAPESATPDQIAELARGGVIVALGHTDCDHDTARAAFDAGARVVTHLFNAMSQMSSRAPGLVGAALADPRVSCGLIADGVHVHPAAMTVALRAAPGRMVLVTDAMAPAGAGITEFSLTGRRVLRRDGRLTLEDGTLAGADLDMATAIGVLVDRCGVALGDALRMATGGPAALLRDARGAGRFVAGGPWTGIHLARDGTVRPLD